MTTEELTAEPIDDYRLRARQWIEANLQPRSAPKLPGHLPFEEYTPEHMAAHRAIQRRLFEGGFAGITWPREYGGQGLAAAYERVFAEEATRFHTPDFGILSVTTFGSCVPTMLKHASPEFLSRHVPAVLAGEELWCQFFSEPAAGSDLAGVRTRAARDGDRWILDGSKIWSSYAHLADWGMCLARTNWDVPKHRGLTWFGVPTDAPGLTLRPIRQINGTSEFCEEFFDQVTVDDAERIGDVDAGWAVTTTLLVFERGAGRPSVNERPDDPGALAPDLVALARRTGRIDADDARQLIATAHVNDYVYRQLQGRIATMNRLSAVNPGVASYGKVAAATFAAERAVIGLALGGGATVAWSPGERDGDTAATAYLNGRMPAIAGGTVQVQRNGIAEQVLGMPREPSYDRDVAFSEVVRRASSWTGS